MCEDDRTRELDLCKKPQTRRETKARPTTASPEGRGALVMATSLAKEKTRLTQDKLNTVCRLDLLPLDVKWALHPCQERAAFHS